MKYTEILEEAKKEKKVENFACASDFIEAIMVLRDKGLSYPEISKWFYKRGFTFSIPSLRSAYYNSINRLEEKTEESK